MADKYMEKCSISIVIRECQMTTNMKYTPMTKNKKPSNK